MTAMVPARPGQLPQVRPGFDPIASTFDQLPLVTVITILKGGYRKTTTVADLAVEWAEQGERVLVIDMDETNNALTQLFLTPQQVDQKVSRLRSCVRFFLQPELRLDNLIWEIDISLDAADAEGRRRYDRNVHQYAQQRNWKAGGCLHLVAGHPDLSDLRDILDEPSVGVAIPGAARPAKIPTNFALIYALAYAPYTRILIDTAPAKGAPLNAALFAASNVVIPLGFDRYGTGAYNNTLDRVLMISRQRVEKGLPELHVAAVTAGGYDQGREMHRLLWEQYVQRVGPELVRNPIPFDIAVVEALQLGVPTQLYAPHQPAAQTLRYVAAEVAEKTSRR